MSKIAQAQINRVKARVVDRINRIDGWLNDVSGIGTPRDKATLARFSLTQIGPEQLEQLYNGDDLAARICDVVPEEALRMPFEIKIEASDDGATEQANPDEPTPSKITVKEAMEYGSDLLQQAEALGLTTDTIDAWVYARALGGAALFVGSQDGASKETLVEPLNEDGIESVDFIHVIDRRHLFPATWYQEVSDEKFGQVETYWLTPQVSSASAAPTARGTARVHESRLVIFDGVRTTIRQRQTDDGWGMAVLQRVDNVLRQFQITWQAVTNVLQDADQAVFKVQGLIDTISSEEQDTITKRLKIVDQQRSVARAIVIDAEMEEFTRDDPNLGGYDSMLDRFSLRLAAAARMPVTILMGQSPAGMNATGESDIRWFYDTIAAAQTHYLRPKLARVIKQLMLADDRGVPENWSIEFAPLWQETPEQEATTRKLIAETDAIYIDAGVVLEEEVAISRFPVTGYAADMTIDLQMRKDILDIVIERAVEEAENPPPPPKPTFGAPVPEEDGNTGHLEEDDADA